MTIEIVSTEHIASVSGVSALPIAFNAESGYFQPDFIKVQVSSGRLDVDVSGPVLHPTTKRAYKTKRGSVGWGKEDFLEENLDAPDAPPQWVVDFVTALGYIPVRESAL